MQSRRRLHTDAHPQPARFHRRIRTEAPPTFALKDTQSHPNVTEALRRKPGLTAALVNRVSLRVDLNYTSDHRFR